MRVLFTIAVSFVAAMQLQSASQSSDLQVEESFDIAGEHPLLFLTRDRLRLLRRERERQSMRWQQFSALVGGGARLPEPGLAFALYYQIAGDRAAGRRAVDWALGETADTRQSALVLDWCAPLMEPRESDVIARRLEHALADAPSVDVPGTRDRVLAAVALADRDPKLSSVEMERVVKSWWRGRIAPRIAQGRVPVRREEIFPLFEILHAVRNATGIDLRESARDYFITLPLIDLLGYYPAVYPSPENDFRIPAVKGGSVDLRVAAQARAGDLEMVAYDTNARENQFLQGWLMHDRFAMRGVFGAPYEFLWANPYHPGLSYYNAPLTEYAPSLGRLYLRSSWDDDAAWLAFFDGELQTFASGRPAILPLKIAGASHAVADAVVITAAEANLRVGQSARWVFLVGLEPRALYQVEIADREMREEHADAGGIIAIDFPTLFQGDIVLRRVSANK